MLVVKGMFVALIKTARVRNTSDTLETKDGSFTKKKLTPFLNWLCSRLN